VLLSVRGEAGDELPSARSLAAEAPCCILRALSAQCVVVARFSAFVAGVSSQPAESHRDCPESVGQKYVTRLVLSMFEAYFNELAVSVIDPFVDRYFQYSDMCLMLAPES